MIQKITVNPNTKASEILFFQEADLTKLPDPRIVMLFGPNGAGKSTLIEEIIACGSKNQPGIHLTHTDTPMHIYSYENATDNFKNRKERSYIEAFNPFFLSGRMDAHQISEGQSILYSVLDLFDGMKPGKGMFQSEGETLVLFDEIDSGLSIDNIDMLMRKIKYVLRKRQDLQIIMSFNSPRVLRYFPNVISMYDGSVLYLKTDEDMLAEIRRHKKEFDKARKLSNGRPKVYR